MFNDTYGLHPALDAPALPGAPKTGYRNFVDRVKIPALPSSGSDAVVLADIVSFQPYFSADHTAIFTEIKLQPEQVFKDSSGTISQAEPITIVEQGGAIKLDNGKIVTFPSLGGTFPLASSGKYALFLRYSANYGAFQVRKGWQISGGKAYPTNPADRKTADGGPLVGADEATFLSAVQGSVAGGR